MKSYLNFFDDIILTLQSLTDDFVPTNTEENNK